MLPDKINEYGQMYEISQITIGDLIRRHNEISDLKYQLMDLQSLKDAVDRLSKLLGYFDMRDVINRAPHAVTHDINPHAIGGVHGNFKSPNTNELLHIDKFGNIWLNGVVENNPTKIGLELMKLASNYKDNLPLSDFAQYFKPTPVQTTTPAPVVTNDDFADLPF